MIEKPNTATFAAAGTSSPSAAEQPTQVPNSQRISLLNLMNPGGIVRANTAEELSKADKAIKESIKVTHFASDFRVLVNPVDNQQVPVRYASVILSLLHERSNQMAYHTLLLEGSADPMPAQNQTINSIPVVIKHYAARSYDSVYDGAVSKMVSTSFPGIAAYNTGVTSVPRGFAWDDAAAVRELVINTMIAAATKLESKLDGFVDMNMARMGADRLQVNVTYNNPDTSDFTGLPVRSDVQITCTAMSNTDQSNKSQNTGAQSVAISRVTGYLDLSYEVANNQNGFAMGMMGAQGMYRRYRPRLIITRLENNRRMTPAGQLFAIASALGLGKGLMYYRGFAPRKNIKGRDLRDIGAVNIECNLPQGPDNRPDPSGFGKIVETKSANFDDKQLAALLNETLHPGLVVSIDVSDAGADTWYNSIFARAAMGDNDAMGALLNAANELTGGAFSRRYQAANAKFAPVLVTGERVLLGKQRNKEGQFEDIRHVDTLAIANYFGPNDPKRIAEWCDTYDRVSEPSELRLHARETMIRAVGDADLTIQQEGTRVTLNPLYTEMLMDALADVGTVFTMVNGEGGANFMTQRLGGTFAQAGMSGNPSNLFRTGFGNTNNASFSTTPWMPGAF